MILSNLIVHLGKVFHENLALEWDRIGLQIGELDSDIERILVTLDIDGSAMEKASRKKANLIISHHPLIFDSLDSITSAETIQKKILRLAREKIAVYCAHTNYDIMPGGLNDLIVQKMGLTDILPIEANRDCWYKFVVFVPKKAEEKIREAMCGAGGGRYKNYACCTFNLNGMGTFIPLEGAHPYTGNIGDLSYVDEVRMECMVRQEDLQDLISSVTLAHPYEEVAYDIYRLENRSDNTGTGRVGKIPAAMTIEEFLNKLKNLFKTDAVGWISAKKDASLKKKIKKVAVVNGSASSLTTILARLECDLVVAGEISYHNALEISEAGKTVVMLGHGTSEKWASYGMCMILEKYFKENGITMEILNNKAGYTPWRYYIG